MRKPVVGIEPFFYLDQTLSLVPYSRAIDMALFAWLQKR
jgi:hypothetical protein